MVKSLPADWSTTNASNTDVGGTDITGTTGLVKNGDNALREIMAQVKAGVLGNLGYATTATAAGTTTLTVTSPSFQYFTGSTTQTVVMPVTSTLTLGMAYQIVNNSTGALTVNSSGGNLILTVNPGQIAFVQCILLSGTTAASWNATYTPFAKSAAVASAGTTVLVSNAFQHITGTTTITDIDFSPAVDGASAWVEFDGALTLTHNATTLTLPGQANITTAAGDRMFVVQDSGDNAHVLFYQPYAAMSGTYTPTSSTKTNVAADTPALSRWTQVGLVVTVFGSISITPTASAPTTTILNLTLPVASNFGAATDANGLGNEVLNNQPSRFTADAANDKVTMTFVASSTAARTHYYTFQYTVI